MRVLVLGASGMLGFAVHRALSRRGVEVTGAIRASTAPDSAWCRGLRYATRVDVENLSSVLRVLADTGADVVINATGARPGATADAQRRLFAVNSVFPRLLDTEAASDVYIVHFSSDGVFSGARGMYDEGCRPDPVDLYGMSKFLGEPASERCLVVRTSMIGRATGGGSSLVDWFLAQDGVVKGFRRAIFSGLPVNEIAAVLVERVLPRPERLAGVFHLSGWPISKYALLTLIKQAWSLRDVDVEPVDTPVIDRSLDSSRLREMIGYSPPPWDALMPRMRDYYAALDADAAVASP